MEQQTGYVVAYQASLLFLEQQSSKSLDKTGVFSAKVTKINSDRGTCDLITTTEPFENVPVLCKVGINLDGSVWGEIEYPAEGSYVVVQPLDRFAKKKIIVGSFIPYLTAAFGASQVAVNSTNKTYTKKLLDSALGKVWRRIFQSGTTQECKADGSFIIETPSGTLFLFDETAKQVKISQKDGASICSITLSGSAGLSIVDKDNNTIRTTATSVIINENLEVLR